MREAQFDPAEAQEVLTDRLDRVGGELVAMRSDIADEIASLRVAQPDPEMTQNLIGERLEAIELQVASFRSALADPAVIGQISSIVSEQSTALTALQAAQPQLAIRLDHLAADLAELATRADTPVESPLALERLDRIVGDIAALRSAQSDPDVAQTFFVEQLDGIGAQLAALRTIQPDPEALIGMVVSTLDQHLDGPHRPPGGAAATRDSH